ncbi:MAG: GNAT family N-acetyltransferase [Thermovirgaceae bacterium]|nr:GNAT family N-acetyltransferase [Thermovirgaceae bacterium]
MKKSLRAKASEYLLLAERTGAFSRPELDVLDEVLRDWASKPGVDYRLESITDEGALAGFALWGRTPMTGRGYDVYWIAVDPTLQGKGLGKKLMACVEEGACRETDGCILRIETSGREEYASQRIFYVRCGFEEVGRIKDFYREEDDLVTFVKRRNS